MVFLNTFIALNMYLRPATAPVSNTFAVVNLINVERAKVGAPPVTLDSRLIASAKAKCEDMVERRYWSHYTPDGEEPWVFFNDVRYKGAGENLGTGSRAAKTLVQGWQDSPEHKEIQLDPSFNKIGIASCGIGFDGLTPVKDVNFQSIVVAHYIQE